MANIVTIRKEVQEIFQPSPCPSNCSCLACVGSSSSDSDSSSSNSDSKKKEKGVQKKDLNEPQMVKVKISFPANHPQLLKYWDYEKNGTKVPAMYTADSLEYAQWKCPDCGYEWKASIKDVVRSNGCPNCNNHVYREDNLATFYPLIADTWLYEKNGTLLPTNVTAHSNRKVWWKCPVCGYEWEATVKNRTNNGRGCPVCAGKAILKGLNDLATVNPKLAKEWNDEKNGDLRPDMVTANSTKKVWWKCKKCGYEWEATIDRRNGHGCPVCAGKAILKGLNDLATVNPKLAAEWNYEKNGDLRPDMVTANSKKKVWWKCPICGYEWEAVIYSRTGGSGCPVCANKAVLKGYNDLATVNPKLAAEWDYEKNGDLRPNMVTAGSNKKVWWRCPICGYEWEAMINDRTSGRGCPVCARRAALKGLNDLATVNPKLAAEWNYEKNGDLRPDMVTAGSTKKVWWKCKKCGYEWEATIDRRNGHGCPVCAGKVVLKGLNDLATVNPKLAAEWNYEKNGDLRPDMVTAGSNKKVWWRCPVCGYEWEATIASRTTGRGCPICAAGRMSSFPENAIAYYIPENMVFVQNCRSYGKEFDIYFPNEKIAIEYDGEYFHQDVNKDLEKNALAEKHGIRLIRIREKKCPDITGEVIKRNNSVRDESLGAAIKKLFKLLGIKGVDIDIKRDRMKITEFMESRSEIAA